MVEWEWDQIRARSGLRRSARDVPSSSTARRISPVSKELLEGVHIGIELRNGGYG